MGTSPDPSEGGFSEPGATDPQPPAGAAGDGRRYTFGPRLGSGGMGIVSVARDRSLGRDVALKELRPELSLDGIARLRLEREAAITSRLDHPNIVSVHDIGRREDGRPFYTMRLVRGRSLASAADAATARDGRHALIRHVLAAAEAVAAAHDAGVVHRDLKPANILIGPHGETQVVDWGLATALPSAAARWADLPPDTTTGPVGTASYMSPEQHRGAPPSAAQDVYGLGVTLRVLAGRGDPELAAIVARATAPDPDGRYPDAGAFADDLLRWFERRPVAAYAYTPADRLRRALSAYGLPLGVGALGLAAVLVAATVGWWETSRSLVRAREAEARAADALTEIQLEQAVAATAADDRERAERLALAVLSRREDPLARGVLAAFGRSGRPEQIARAPGPRCRWSTLTADGWLLCGDERGVSRWDGEVRRWEAPVRADGGEVANGVAWVWEAPLLRAAFDAETGAPLPLPPAWAADWRPLRAPYVTWAASGPVDPARAPPTGCPRSLVATATLGDHLAALCEDGALVLADGSRRATDVRGDHVGTTLAFTPAGDLVAGTLRGRAVLLDGGTGEVRAQTDTELGQIVAIRVDPTGRFAALTGADGVGVWRLDDGAFLGRIPSERPRSTTFTAEGLVIFDGERHTWRLPEGAPRVLRADAGLSEVAVSADGRSVMTVGGGGWAGAFDLQTGGLTLALFGDRVVKSAADGPGGWVVAGVDEPLVARPTSAGWERLPDPRALRRVAVLPDGSVYGAHYGQGLVRWGGDGPPDVIGRDHRIADLDRDGAVLFALDDAGRALRVDGDALAEEARQDGARAIAAHAGRIALAGEEEVWLSGEGRERRLEAPGAGLIDVALSADGRRVAAAGLDARIRVWDADSGQLLGVLPGHAERVVSVKFLPDGDLVSASWDRTARLWSLAELTRPLPSIQADLQRSWGTK